jgi:predicted nucleotidyltransferase
MKRDNAVGIFSACAGELREQYGITVLSLFGSVARDDGNDATDVLVSFRETPTYTALRFDPKDPVGTRVALVTRSGLKARVRPHVVARRPIAQLGGDLRIDQL